MMSRRPAAAEGRPDNPLLTPHDVGASRYMNLEFDAPIDRHFIAVPQRERVEVLGQIMHPVSAA